MNSFPFQFERPLWLVFIPVSWIVVLLLSRRSLTGLGPVTRAAAIAIRCIVLGLLFAALAEPSHRKEGKGVALLLVLDKSESMPQSSVEALKKYMEFASQDATPEDRMAIITAAEQGRAQELASAQMTPSLLVKDRLKRDDWDPGPRDATNLAEGIRLAMAVKPEDCAARIVLASDGNENRGSLLAAAEAAKAAGIPIDIYPARFDVKNEVIFDQVVAPATARKGQTIDLRFLITSTRAARGKLSLLINGRPHDLSPKEPGDGTIVELTPGNNILKIPVEMRAGGPQQFEAVFEPEAEPGKNGEAVSAAGMDTYAQNNRAQAVTFVSTEGKLLMLTDDTRSAADIARVLNQARLGIEVKTPAEAPQSLVELQRYDAVILDDVPASDFSGRQMQELASYVRDSGGGLVMVGGPNSFGAGGWIGTPVADVLPVKLDPPEKRQIPRGAMVLIMHSCEMPQGNFWGQKTAQAAVDVLSRLDLIGVTEAAFMGVGANGGWVYPLSPKGDGVAVAKAIANLNFTDMFDFTPSLQAALQALSGVKAGFKHVVIISDGDPQGPSAALLAQFIQNKITISTVEVFPHTNFAQLNGTMQNMADKTGGKYYLINQLGQIAKLPQIFIKEAQVIRRTLIWEGDPARPEVTAAGSGSETMRGVGSILPPISGYVVTADREGLSMITSRMPGENPDPITAQWQHGLGRAVAVTTDAASRWSPEWVQWPRFAAFWEQHVRWAMRPTGSANVSVITEKRGDDTHVVATMLSATGEPLNFARVQSRAVAPDMKTSVFDMRQTGPGRYEGDFTSEQAGSYLVSLRYDAPMADGDSIESGSVQAAVTRRGADEFRTLRDNAPLLEQVATMTGGKELSKDPTQAGLFSKDGLEMPVALRPVWLGTVLLAMGLFLLDVAVRRVRIDIPAMARAVRGLGSKSREVKADVGSLKGAREQARARMAARQVDGGGTTAGVKFEGTPGKDAAPIVSKAKEIKTERPAAPPAEKTAEEEGMSRLMKAKKRAQDRMEE